VQLRNLSVAPGANVAVTLSVSWPPSCTTTSVAWNAVAALTSDLSGGSIDQFTLDSSPPSSPGTSLVDSCHLSVNAEPQSAVVNQDITNVAYSPPPSGGPVTVEILDLSNAVVTSSTAQVTVAIGINAGGTATLGGTPAENAVAGVATFANLTLSEAGIGYTLTASSSVSATEAISTPFDIQAVVAPCTGNSCTESLTNSNGNAQVQGVAPSGSTPSGSVVGSVNPTGSGALTCGTYKSADPNIYAFFTTDESLGKVVTLDITDPIQGPTGGPLPPYNPLDTDGFHIWGGDGDHDYDDVLWTQQICFQAPYTFTPLPGTTLTTSTNADGTTVYTGLLPDCPHTNKDVPTPLSEVTTPCQNRWADSAPRDPKSPTGYDIVLVADIPAAVGDPFMN
jgi:hypothetical protein